MDRIFIPRLLKAPQQQEQFAFAETLADLETLTPVRGEMAIAHRQTYLEVIAQAETIVTLTCDRCLQHYNTRLTVDRTELIWLQNNPGEDLPAEREVSLEDLDESLDPHGYFEPETWLYEQFCLEMPLRKVCDPQRCPGAETSQDDGTPQIDARWAKLADLKQQLSS
ncbi:metal-binding protein [Picosynechococcus sp. PCC 7003]|uniref:YceD family protein n=1 Tax=Picosynechococcus sp. PCC 7003 TaxID=374981 RepID=UPI000810E4AC|nr:YceD family protein [Picosynechococcus sp. PCC 7003]ANV83737.1 metal-binding protein [Picosynechococcus sp. PCC 7003]